jgi:hypothetical protein
MRETLAAAVIQICACRDRGGHSAGNAAFPDENCNAF